MKVIQIVEGYKKGDGIGNVVASIDELLKRNHYEALICARRLEKADVESSLFTGDTVVFYHLAHLMDPVIKYLRCNKVLIFHNITEPELLEGTDEGERIRCSAGLYDTAKAAQYFDYAITFSEYSRECLIAMGWRSEIISVLPIIVRLNHFSSEPSKEIIHTYKEKQVNILFTGRIWPNKKQEDIIAAFAAYKQRYCKNAKLFLVGNISKGNYYSSLCAYAKKLGVSGDIIFPGHVTFEEYLAYYHIADMYLCMSEHEGFCIPLVEAMYFEVPIIAYASTAVPNTLAGSGILLNVKEPESIARTMNEVMVNRGYRQTVVESQNIRLKQLLPEVLEDQYVQLLKEVVSRLGVKNNIPARSYNDKYQFSLISNLFGQMGKPVETSEKYVIYGAGAAGKKLYSELKRESKKANLAICDSFKGGEYEPKLDCSIISPKEAVESCKKGIYIVSVQDKRAILETVMFLLEQGIKKEQIFLYDMQRNQII